LTKLNLDRSIDRLSKKLNRLYPGDNNNAPGYWRGRKIIPKDQWLRMAHTISSKTGTYNVRAGLQYFPDSYIEHVFPFGVPEDLEAETKKWYSDYIELMQHKKDPDMEVRNVMGAYYVHRKTNLEFIRSLPGVWSRKRKREKSILRFTRVR
jgi:hypothetical protein